MTQTGNGRAPISKEVLADRSRFQFKREELDLSEHITGVVLTLKTLSVAEQESLPDFVDEKGEASYDVPKLARMFAAIVEEPKVTAEEAEAFLGDWPLDALNLVIERFGRLAGNTREEQRAAAATFPDSD